MSNEINHLYEFGKFRFNAQTNTLWRDGELISLPPKALELLKLLIERQGEVVSKQEIFETVWADTFVEDGVLTQNIYTLRQTLGTDENGKQLIENLARRGYRLSVPVVLEGEKGGKGEREWSEPSAVAGGLSDKPNISKFVIITAGIILFLLIGFLTYRFLTSQPAETSKTSAELKFKQLTDTGDVSYLTISPDGNSVAYTRGFNIYLRNLQTNSENKLKIENASKIGCLQFSPDGNQIYFGDVFNRIGQIQFLPIRRFGRDHAHHDSNTAALTENIHSKTPKSIHSVRDVRRAFLVKRFQSLLVTGQHQVGHRFDLGRRESFESWDRNPLMVTGEFDLRRTPG